MVLVELFGGLGWFLPFPHPNMIMGFNGNCLGLVVNFLCNEKFKTI